MPDIYDVANEARRQLLAGDREAAKRLIGAYGQGWRRIRVQLDGLTQQMAEARATGQPVGVSWLYQQQRLQLLQQQIEAEIMQFGRVAGGAITAGQDQAVYLAQRHAEELMMAGLGEPPLGIVANFARLPRGAVQDLVGFLSDGSPLSALLDELGPEASQGVRKALIAGLVSGQGPRAIARVVRQHLGGNLVRALTISRTEILRSYRMASARTYQANSDVVKGWIWHSALGSRTCAACFSMHGSVHSLDEHLDDHPNGKCSMVPITSTWSSLGFKNVPETQAQVPKGADLFDKLSDADKEKVLGKAALQAYKDGAVTLKDFVGRKRSERWGTMRYTRSLRDILGKDTP